MAPPRNEKRERPPLGDPSRPRTMGAQAERFLEYLRVRHYSDRTVGTHREHLALFLGWCEDRGITDAKDVTKRILERYQRHVFYYRKKNGQPLAPSSQHGRLIAARVFFRWLVKSDLLPSNPASDLELPRVNKRLPKHVLTITEVEHILALPDLDSPLGLRDRALLETLYSTGMRRMEIIGLKLYDVDDERGTVLIRLGKGRKDRMVPLGERAAAFLSKYIHDARPELVMEPDDGTLFLTRMGDPFGLNALSRLVHEYVEKAGIGKRGSCHLFRHTMATLMLEGGADIRYIQAMLGHSNLSTTEIYTQVAIKQLKQIHSATHPGAKLERRRRTHDDESRSL